MSSVRRSILLGLLVGAPISSAGLVDPFHDGCVRDAADRTAADTFITFSDETRAYLETALDSISVVLLASG